MAINKLKAFSNKFLKDIPKGEVDGISQIFLTKQLKSKYGVPLVLAPFVVQGANASAGQRYQTMGPNIGVRKLSNMTDSVLGSNPDDNIIVNPYIKAMTDHSTKDRAKYASHLEKNMERSVATDPRIYGDLVFALHNLR